MEMLYRTPLSPVHRTLIRRSCSSCGGRFKLAERDLGGRKGNLDRDRTGQRNRGAEGLDRTLLVPVLTGCSVEMIRRPATFGCSARLETFLRRSEARLAERALRLFAPSWRDPRNMPPWRSSRVRAAQVDPRGDCDPSIERAKASVSAEHQGLERQYQSLQPKNDRMYERKRVDSVKRGSP